jgi:chemotaxis protein MotA
MKGVSPLLAVEMGRRAVPAHLRPGFAEFEKYCKQSAAAAAAAPEGATADPEPAAAAS